MINKRKLSTIIALIIFIFIFPIKIGAAELNENRYYIGKVVNTGKDNGYSGNKEIKKDDPHFGWSMCYTGRKEKS